MIIETLSVFPDMFEGPMSASIVGRARERGILDFTAYDLRDWTHDKHRSTDDEVYGGGQGLLMMCPPIFEAYDDIASRGPKPYTIFFTPAGEPFSQGMAVELAEKERILMVCGRYEGFDERAYSLADRCVSIGDYVLTGGELPAMVVTDAVTRLLPGVLGDEGSAVEESFADGLLEFPQYTRPAEYRGMQVPEILLSGNHQEIYDWRRSQALERTARRRPDLLRFAAISDEERERLEHLSDPDED
ncbi:MAG: tRNA (guanosine(37)-N1)-methyltransferase TrmD [Coriobacteriaceae bacterium]|nr:tRNA (guanosine(37)-N1)-methyltransferase TrmD [Coriobacteriaceae bacterium]